MQRKYDSQNIRENFISAVGLAILLTPVFFYTAGAVKYMYHREKPAIYASTTQPSRHSSESILENLSQQK